MVNKDKILKHAEIWLAKQTIPRECPRDNCTAVDRWRLGPVSKVNRAEYDKEIRRARGIKDPELYLVQVICDWCGHIERTYEEEVPLASP